MLGSQLLLCLSHVIIDCVQVEASNPGPSVVGSPTVSHFPQFSGVIL